MKKKFHNIPDPEERVMCADHSAFSVFSDVAFLSFI